MGRWPSLTDQKQLASRGARVPYMKAYDIATKNMAA